MIENFNGFEYEIGFERDDNYPSVKYYYYIIYNANATCDISSDTFESEEEARFSAVGHILSLKIKRSR